MWVEDLSRIGAGRLPSRRPSSAPPEHVIGTLRRSRRLREPDPGRFREQRSCFTVGDSGLTQTTSPPQRSILSWGTIGTRVRSPSRRVHRQLSWLGPPYEASPQPSSLARGAPALGPAYRCSPQAPAAASFTVLADQQSSPSASFSARGSPPTGRLPARVGVGGRRRFLVRARRPPRRLAVAVRAGRGTGGLLLCLR